MAYLQPYRTAIVASIVTFFLLCGQLHSYVNYSDRQSEVYRIEREVCCLCRKYQALIEQAQQKIEDGQRLQFDYYDDARRLFNQAVRLQRRAYCICKQIETLKARRSALLMGQGLRFGCY